MKISMHDGLSVIVEGINPLKKLYRLHTSENHSYNFHPGCTKRPNLDMEPNYLTKTHTRLNLNISRIKKVL